MLAAAAGTGRPLIPVFIADEAVAGLGAAPRWRLGEGLAVFARTLAGKGSRLILRRAARSTCCAHWWPRPARAASGGAGFTRRR